MHLFHVVHQGSHLQLQIPEGELHLLPLLHLQLLLLLHPPQLIFGCVVHHGGVSPIFHLLFQLESIASFAQKNHIRCSEETARPREETAEEEVVLT